MPAPRFATLLALIVAVAGCKSKKDGDPAGSGGGRAVAPADAAPADARPVAGPDDPVEGARVAAVPLAAPTLAIEHAVLVPAAKDLEATGQAILAAAKQRGLPVLAPDAEPTGEPQLMITVGTLAEAELTPERLALTPRGIAEADAGKVAAAAHAIVLTALGPTAARERLDHDANAIALAGARRARGWIHDGATFETFSVEAFEAARRDVDALDVVERVMVHSGRGEELLFLETVGMSRYGLPDLFLDGVTQLDVERAVLMLSAAAQALVELGEVTQAGELGVELATLTPPRWKDTVASARAAGGASGITWRVTWSKGDNAEATSPTLLELAPLRDDPAALRYALDSTLGAGDEEMVMVDRDPELVAASARARAALAKLAPMFAEGVPTGTTLMVKAPFATDDGGVEYMWVEATGWKADKIAGVLANEPFDIASLHSGDRVEVTLADVYDYTLERPDGTTEGGETSEIIERKHRAAPAAP